MTSIRLRVRQAAAHIAGLPGWQVVRNGVVLSSFPRQADAFRYARRVSEEVLEDGFEAELAVVDSTGYVETECFRRPASRGRRFDLVLAAEPA